MKTKLKVARINPEGPSKATNAGATREALQRVLFLWNGGTGRRLGTHKKALETLEKRFSTLNIPMIVDRAPQEKTNYGKAEWIKVYGAIYGQEKKARQIYEKYIKEHKEKKNEQK